MKLLTNGFTVIIHFFMTIGLLLLFAAAELACSAFNLSGGVIDNRTLFQCYLYYFLVLLLIVADYLLARCLDAFRSRYGADKRSFPAAVCVHWFDILIIWFCIGDPIWEIAGILREPFPQVTLPVIRTALLCILAVDRAVLLIRNA